jgi:hypothetical protein
MEQNILDEDCSLFCPMLCEQVSSGSIGMYLCSLRVQIVTILQCDVSCKKIFDLHPEVSKLSPKCRGLYLLC